MKIKITLTEEMLGTQPQNKEIHAEFIGSRSADAERLAEEQAALPAEELIAKGKTVFYRAKRGTSALISVTPGAQHLDKDDKKLVHVSQPLGTVLPDDSDEVPAMMDYHFKGMFKDACGMLGRVKETESSKLKAYKKIIDGLIFVNPRIIPIYLPIGASIGECQRPLRISGAQGERTALANSETVPAGSWMELEITCLDPAHLPAVKEWLNYGQLRGLGQWRNSGKGRFTYVVVE